LGPLTSNDAQHAADGPVDLRASGTAPAADAAATAITSSRASLWGLLRLVATVALVCTGLLFGGRALVAHIPSISPLGWFKSSTPNAGSATCYRTIDMSRLTSLMVSDLLTRSNGKSAAEAQDFYRAQLQKMDATISALADSCLLIRREAIVAAPAGIDVSAQVAGELGLDWSRAQKIVVPDALPGATPAATPAAAPGSAASSVGSNPTSPSAGSPALDN
jgi:hypothetical protein